MMFEFEKGQWKQIDSDIQRELNNFSKKTGSEKPIKNRFDMTIQQQAESLIGKYYQNIKTNTNHRLEDNKLKTDLVPICQKASIQCAILEVQSKIDLLKDTKTKLQKEYLECENHLEQQGYANCNMLLNKELNQLKEIREHLKNL